MKVYLDRNDCNITNDASCEKCFGNRLELKEFDLGGCVLEVKEVDDKENIHIYMTDRDGGEKYMHATTENWAEVYDGWMKFYEEKVVTNE